MKSWGKDGGWRVLMSAGLVDAGNHSTRRDPQGVDRQESR